VRREMEDLFFLFARLPAKSLQAIILNTVYTILYLLTSPQTFVHIYPTLYLSSREAHIVKGPVKRSRRGYA
jgi:hypothetical protein